MAATTRTTTQYTYKFNTKAELSIAEVKRLVRLIGTESVERLKIEGEQWLRDYVPRRTGQLRDNAILNLQSSGFRGGHVSLVLGSDIFYADYVNQMTDSQVQHHGEIGYAHYGGEDGRVRLNDPNAKGHWKTEFKRWASERLGEIIKEVTRDLVGMPSKFEAWRWKLK